MRLAKWGTIVALLGAGAFLAIAGTCAVVVAHLKFGDPKGPTAIPWAGDGSPTDGRAADLARGLMALHGRDASHLDLRGLTKEADGGVLVTFIDAKTGWTWFVVLRREGGRWLGETRYGT